MRNLQVDRIQHHFVETFGVTVAATVAPGASGPVIEVAPADLANNEGFAVSVRIGWRTIEVDFRPGRYAGDFIALLGRSATARRTALAFFEGINRSGGQLRLVINGVELNPLDVNAWPTVPWKNLEIRAWSHPLVPEELGQQQIEREVMRWGGSVFGAILALAGVDEAVESEEEWPSEPEGSRTTGLINRYERSPVNRAACIAALGATCRACGFDFGAVYGDAAEGFIHVHHVTPVSQLGAGYRVDPVRDLVPVCPNCHAFIHLREPPYTVQEVRMILHARRT